MTTKDVPEGGTTRGREGKLPSVKKAPAAPMELTVREPLPAGVMVKVFWEEFVTATLPKSQAPGATAMPADADETVTVNALASIAVSVPVVTVSARAPSAATGSILRTAVAVVDELTVRETTAMPAPNAAVVVP